MFVLRKPIDFSIVVNIEGDGRCHGVSLGRAVDLYQFVVARLQSDGDHALFARPCGILDRSAALSFSDLQRSTGNISADAVFHAKEGFTRFFFDLFFFGQKDQLLIVAYGL